MKKDLSLNDGTPVEGTPEPGTLGETLRSQGVSRRSFMKFCATANFVAIIRILLSFLNIANQTAYAAVRVDRPSCRDFTTTLKRFSLKAIKQSS